MLLRAANVVECWWDTQIESELLIYFTLNISWTKGAVVMNVPEHLQTRNHIMSNSDSFIFPMLSYDMEFIFYMFYLSLQTYQQRLWGTYIHRLNASKIFHTICRAAAQHRQTHAGSPWCHRCGCSRHPAGAKSAVSPLCDLSCSPRQNIASQHPKKQPHKPGEEDVLIRTRVAIHLSYKIFKFKDLPTGTLGLSAFLVQTLPVCECYLLQ